MRENEKAFLDLIKQDVFKVYKNGKIYRYKRSNGKGEYRNVIVTLVNIKNNCGYIMIFFRYQKKNMHILASRAVWIYFNGKIPEDLEINHKNCIVDDNRLSNLEIVTKSENMIHAYKNELLKNQCGENNGNHKLKNKDVIKIKKLLKKNITQEKIAKMFNVARSTVGMINIKKNWI